MGKLTSDIDSLTVAHDAKWKKCSESGKQMNKVLSDLQILPNHLKQLYEEFDWESAVGHVFLSQIDLKDFQLQEEEHNSVLKNYIERQFFEGIAKVSSGEEDADFCFRLNVKNPNLSLVQESNRDEYLYNCLALDRLCKIYPAAKGKQIDAQLQLSQKEAKLSRANDFRKSFQGGRLTTDIAHLQHMQTDNRLQIIKLESKIKQLRDNTIVKQIEDCANALAVRTVAGDYTLKLIRQKYVSSKLDKVLLYLVSQRSRCELISLLYELELQNHQEMHDLLHTLSEMINGDKTNLQNTLEKFQRLSQAEHNLEGLALNSVCSLFFNLLVSRDNLSHFDSLEKTKLAISELRNSENIKWESNKKNEENLIAQENSQLKLESAAFSEYVSCGKTWQTDVRLPKLVAGLPTVEQKIKQLRLQISEIETVLLNTVREHNAKRKLLHNELIQHERQIFHLFYANPEKLEQLKV